MPDFQGIMSSGVSGAEFGSPVPGVHLGRGSLKGRQLNVS